MSRAVLWGGFCDLMEGSKDTGIPFKDLLEYSQQTEEDKEQMKQCKERLK